ncbi:oligosaccharide flippase family protein [Spirochaeta lutea]|uniref:oligosaccharide flippase family protein n=1 Tax=Spirochaeta lutea TaxID=1480694 RepID=UPI0006909EE4|nr:oligosaccharide flippase family protein [Spirochaeta lutea]
MSKQTEFSKFFRGLSGFSIGPIVSALIAFAVVPITTFLISPEELGRGSFFITINQLIQLITVLGFDQAFVREYHQSTDKKSLFTNSFIPPLLFSGLIGIIVVIWWKPVSNLVVEEQSFLVAGLLCVSAVLSVVLRFSSLLIRMREKALLYSVFNISNKVTNVLVLLLFAYLIQADYLAVVVAFVTSLVLTSLLQRLYLNKTWELDLKSLNIREQVSYLKYGTPLAIAGAFMWILNSMDKVALRSWSTFYELGLYSNAFRIAGLFTIIQTAFSTFYAPTSYRWYSEEPGTKRFSIISSLMAYVLTIIFIVVAVSKDLVKIIIDESYYASLTMIPFLLFFPVMYTLSETTGLAISFKRKTWLTLVVTIVAAMVNLVGNILLVPTYGGFGASVSTGISFIVFFWLRTLIAHSQLTLVTLKPHVFTTLSMLLIAILVSINVQGLILYGCAGLLILIFTRLAIKKIYEFKRI